MRTTPPQLPNDALSFFESFFRFHFCCTMSHAAANSSSDINTTAERSLLDVRGVTNIGALIMTYTILGVPYCDYSPMGPQTLF